MGTELELLVLSGLGKQIQMGRGFWGQRACSGLEGIRRALGTHPSRKNTHGDLREQVLPVIAVD